MWSFETLSMFRLRRPPVDAHFWTWWLGSVSKPKKGLKVSGRGKEVVSLGAIQRHHICICIGNPLFVEIKRIKTL